MMQDCVEGADELEVAALRLLAAREHSRWELRKKLAKHHADPERVEQLLDRLQEADLQSDERFAESFIASRIGKGQGPLRIRSELKERGVEAGLIERGMECFEAEWRDLLEQVHDAKYGCGRVRESRELAKRARFLEYRGFPGEMIREFLFG
jgi:regulatory protein